MPEATAKIAVAIKHDIDAGSFTGFSWEMITARNVSSIWDWDTHAERWFHYNPYGAYFDMRQISPDDDDDLFALDRDESQLDSSIIVSDDGHMLTHEEILQFAHDGLLKYDA